MPRSWSWAPSTRPFIASCARHRGFQRERQGSDREKHGVPTGRFVITITGEPFPHLGEAPLRSWTMGTGAVMVPCGDQRDFEFAEKYGQDIVPIICEKDGLIRAPSRIRGTSVRDVDWDGASGHRGGLVQSGAFQRPRQALRRRRGHPPGCLRSGCGRRCSSACATGSSAASATLGNPSP